MRLLRGGVMRGGGMTIGGLAKAAGVNVETIRYYQRRGLVDEPVKPPGGQRRYADTREIAERKYSELGRRTQQLNGMRKKLKQLIAKSLKAKPTGPCPIILALS